MFKHLFKLIWNKKKENFLLISEVLISFMIIFAVFTLLVNSYQNYKRPMGLEYEHVWEIQLGTIEQQIKSDNLDSIAKIHETLKNALKALPQVRSVSYGSGNTPFSNSTIRSALSYEKKNTTAELFNVDDDYKETLKLQLLSGRWFSAADDAAGKSPIVVTESFVEATMPGKNPIGKLLQFNGDETKIIGVVQDIKKEGDFKPVSPTIFARISPVYRRYIGNLLVNVAPDANIGLEGDIYKLVASVTKNPNLEISHLTTFRAEKNNEVLVPLIIVLIVAGFLIINVALGLFGVLWYNINKRRAEIGLRRAIGASAGSVYGQLVGEALVLATFSIIIGSFFAIQFPILHVFDLPASVYLTAQLLATIFIYLLVIICALYPGRQAASIYPAVALHEE